MIHPSAIIGDKVKIGKDVKIGPYCVIEGEVTLGNNVELKSHVCVSGITSIGDGTVIFPFACIGGQPQDLKYSGEPSNLFIGKNNSIRQYVTMQPGTKDGGMETVVGDNNLFMVGSHVAHDCKIGNNIILANYATLGGHVEVDDFAIIGGLAAIKQYTKVGKHSIIGGLSGLSQNLIPFGLASNERAKLEGLNLVGLTRRGFNKEHSLQANQFIKELFAQDSINFESKIAEAKEKFPENTILKEIFTFLDEHEKNFCSM